MTEFTPEVRGVIERVEKLLRLASKNTNEHEAAQAASKAQELLTAYNLDMAVVEQESGDKSAKREDTKLRGGFYQFQRDLWRAVADLNFCFYWTQTRYVTKSTQRRNNDGSTYTKTRHVKQFQHRIVGRSVNVVAVKVMAEYLEGTIERLTREHLHGDHKLLFSKWAISYREGACASVCDKIFERRREIMSEERRKKAEAEQRERDAGREGVSTSRTLTIADFKQSEHDANIDFMYGEGTSARWAAERAERARKLKEADEAHAKWAAANPEQARKEEAERRAKERRASQRRSGSGSSKTVDRSAYYAGVDAGRDVSLDQQMSHGIPKERRIGR